MFDERENNLLNNPKKIFAVVLCRNLAYAHLVVAAGIGIVASANILVY